MSRESAPGDLEASRSTHENSQTDLPFIFILYNHLRLGGWLGPSPCRSPGGLRHCHPVRVKRRKSQRGANGLVRSLAATTACLCSDEGGFIFPDLTLARTEDTLLHFQRTTS